MIPLMSLQVCTSPSAQPELSQGHSVFEEEVDDVEVSGECCDMCSCNTVVELADYTKEMEMIVKATDVLIGYGEKKV